MQVKHQKPAQKGQATRRLILLVAFTTFLMGSAEVHAKLEKGFYIFNSEGYANALKKEKLKQLDVRDSCSGAVSWFGRERTPEYARAQFDVGVAYELGRDLPQDYRKAASCYRMAAKQGYADAQNNLGWLYENGKGVPQNYGEAVSWYREAAAQGNADAQFNLGVLYYDGRGVMRDMVQAHMWFSLSEKVLGLEASNIRKSVEAEMTPGQIGEAQQLARKWSKKSHQ